jgi:hypothetical protein
MVDLSEHRCRWGAIAGVHYVPLNTEPSKAGPYCHNLRCVSHNSSTSETMPPARGPQHSHNTPHAQHTLPVQTPHYHAPQHSHNIAHHTLNSTLVQHNIENVPWNSAGSSASLISSTTVRLATTALILISCHRTNNSTEGGQDNVVQQVWCTCTIEARACRLYGAIGEKYNSSNNQHSEIRAMAGL